ncbi:MAG: hypothetical protein ACK4Q5_06505 [Saprospiraceae bacterium]
MPLADTYLFVGVGGFSQVIDCQHNRFEYGFRMFPKHPLLPHRQDFGLVRWL